MSIEMNNPKTVAEKIDAAANLVEQMMLAHNIGDEGHFSASHKKAGAFLFNAMRQMEDEADIDGSAATGIDLIAKERREQLEKHGRTIERDVKENSNSQLSDAASKLCVDDIGGYWPTETCPVGWSQEIWDKMTNKSYKERLIIAGALIAAELDRLNDDDQ